MDSFCKASKAVMAARSKKKSTLTDLKVSFEKMYEYVSAPPVPVVSAPVEVVQYPPPLQEEVVPAPAVEVVPVVQEMAVPVEEIAVSPEVPVVQEEAVKELCTPALFVPEEELPLPPEVSVDEGEERVVVELPSDWYQPAWLPPPASPLPGPSSASVAIAKWVSKVGVYLNFIF